MPDHEEAVREARSDVAIIGGLGSKVGGIESLEYFEESIRASERAKYAALVEAAERALGYCSEAVEAQTDEGTVAAIAKAALALAKPLAALQSKEGTK